VPSTSGWPAWPIITISRTARAHLLDLDVDLRHERARGVENAQTRALRLGAHALRDTDARRTRRCFRRDLVELLDEHRALALRIVDDELVVHDLVPDVDRRAVARERLLDDRDRAIDSGAEATRVASRTLHHAPFVASAAIAPRPAKAVDDEQRRADGDRTVGDIERRIRPLGVVEQQEVDHFAQRQTIDQIAHARRRGSAPGPHCTARFPPRRNSTTITTARRTAIAASSQRCHPTRRPGS
jgi:hypothetical protein